MRHKGRLSEQLGFTLAEVMVAGLILTLALFPMAEMFSTTFLGIKQLENIQTATQCARAAMEEVRSLPFYEPYNGTDVDIDDHYWGTRDPINDNPGTGSPSQPDWAHIPEVAYYGYGSSPDYPGCRVGVQLSYLNDDTGPATMQTDWAPKAPGKDRPESSTGQTLHLLLIHLNVYWMAEDGEKSYFSESIVTDTEAVYNLGISNITVDISSGKTPLSVIDIDPATKTAENPTGTPRRTNAAAHWPDATIYVQMTGWGFNPTTVEASLVRDGSSDIPMTLTSKTDTTLAATFQLYNNPGMDPLWAPRAAIGYWSVRIRQKKTPTDPLYLSTYLYQGFIVQYPKPVISAFGNNPSMTTSGYNNASAQELKIVGAPFVNKVKNPAVSLVRYDPVTREILNQIDGTIVSVTVPSGTGGYVALPTTCTIIAQFDLREAEPGNYEIQVVNTDEPSLQGHLANDPFNPDSSPPGYYYTITETPPMPSDLYVYNTLQKSYVAYSDYQNPWRLVIQGNFFNMVGSPSVEVYICTSVAGGLPSGQTRKGTVQLVQGGQIILADFDLTGLSGPFMAWVKNLNNNLTGWTSTAPLTVKTFSASATAFTSGTGHFYENYYDVPGTVTGTGFTCATGLSITNGTTEYQLDASDYSINTDTQIAINTLNLINCNHNDSWKLRIYFSGGTPSYVERAFTVELGPCKILAQNDYGDTRAAIYIDRASPTSPEFSYETTTSKAKARSGVNATFYVRGMGFPISGNGTVDLKVYRGTSWSREATNLVCTMDRANKIVRIQSPSWSMSNTIADYSIEVKRYGSSDAWDNWSNRWSITAYGN